MKKIRKEEETLFIKGFMLKQIEDFIRLYEEVDYSHNLGIIEALKYKLDEIKKELRHTFAVCGGEE